MRKALAWKFALIAIVIVLALLRLYPPSETIKQGIDLAGGTSLIYEIDTTGMKDENTSGLSNSMITVLKRRVDPQGMRNLIWRPLGSTRFEIQMPLASKEAREARSAYETALNNLLDKNINIPRVIRALSEPNDVRSAEFEQLAGSSQKSQEILSNLANAYDQRRAAMQKADKLNEALADPEREIKAAGVDIETVKDNVGDWMMLNPEKRTEAIRGFLGKDFSQLKLNLLGNYTEAYAKWSDADNELTDPQTGASVVFQQARDGLYELVLTEEELKLQLDKPKVSYDKAVEQLKEEYPDRDKQIQAVADALKSYSKYQGRLDDPRDLQRMLKGAGILEFRILPTVGQEDSDTALLDSYIKNLQEKGPKFASDNKYAWFEIENTDEWIVEGQDGQVQTRVHDAQDKPAVVVPFGSRYYVLCSNKPDETMLHNTQGKSWKLTNASPTADRQGKRAISFTLDERGGKIFSALTGENIGRPLCILLDDRAISAPSINDRIGRQGIITGQYSEEKVADMVDKLNAGSLPAMLIEQPVAEKSIGPSLGAENRDQGIKAGIIGLAVVMVIMLVYYLKAGAIADIALVFNMLVILATMVVMRATFTLPGIAGLILTIGMSVDANVLIFERIREEQKKGASPRIAIKNGYQRALSTILDSNITTFITAFILYWIAPEEIKGFAIVLMIGIISSLIAALFVTRVFFDFMTEFGLARGEQFKWQLFKNVNVNWMALRPVFFVISTLLIVGGLVVFFTRDDSKNNKYDIEFTGGTAATINLTEPRDVQFVRDRITQVGRNIDNPAIAAANVYSVGKIQDGKSTQFEINTTETNKTVTTVVLSDSTPVTAEQFKTAVVKAEDEAGVNLSNLIITEGPDRDNAFIVSTSQLNKNLVAQMLRQAFPSAQISEPQLDEVVNNAIMTAFGDLLEIRRSLEPQITSTEKITRQVTENSPELLDYLGGIEISVTLGRPVDAVELQRRFNDLHFKPEMEEATWYDYELLTPQLKPLGDADNITEFVYVSAMPEAAERELSENEWNQFVESETGKVLAAGRLSEPLPRVTQVNPSIGAEAKQRAMIAMLLSFAAIVIYIWVRFGNIRYGLAAIASLVHDVVISLGAVTVCTYIAST
ncbi:MAG: protein translocase subunit SecD, partial [Phycisphaerae bacterium]